MSITISVRSLSTRFAISALLCGAICRLFLFDGIYRINIQKSWRTNNRKKTVTNLSLNIIHAFSFVFKIYLVWLQFFNFTDEKGLKTEELLCPSPQAFHFSTNPPIRIFSCVHGEFFTVFLLCCILKCFRSSEFFRYHIEFLHYIFKKQLTRMKYIYKFLKFLQ